MIFGWVAAPDANASAAALCVVRAERVVLGALLRGGPCAIDGTFVLRSEDFGQAFHRGIFDTIVRHQHAVCSVKADRIADEIGTVLPNGDVPGYILRLSEARCSASEIIDAVGRVKDAACRRRLAVIAGHLQALASETAAVGADAAADAPPVAEHVAYLIARLKGLTAALEGSERIVPDRA